MITLEAQGKINLTMDVLRKRQDGFHELETIMSSISLSDRIRLEKLPSEKLEFYCSDSSLQGENNIALQAARLLQARFPGKGARIFLEKNIPVAAGLAGGSSNAASVLKGLNLIWELKLQNEELLELAGLLGSDVPFCLLGKMAVARGRGEILTVLPEPPAFWVLLASPFGLPISTSTVYAKLVPEKIKERPRTQDFLNFFYEENLNGMASCMANVLEEVVLPLYAPVGEIKMLMKKYTPCALMSGSGPTVFGLFNEKKNAINAQKNLTKKGYKTFLATMQNKKEM